MNRLVLWTVLLMLTLQPALAQKSDKKGGNVEDQIKQMADQGKDAAIKSDASWLEKNTTDDYVSIGGSGMVLSKSEAIQMRKSGEVKYESIDVSEQKVRTYGNTALMNAMANVKGTVKGNDMTGTYRITQVWVKQGGSWKLANMQSTKVQQQ